MAQPPKDKSFLRRLIEAALDRPENNYPPMAAHATATAARKNGPNEPNGTDLEGQRWNIGSSHPENLIPANDKLLIFRSLTGIDSVPALTQGGYLLRSAPNVGIQIIVAASLTALGAASGPHAVITAFGAINTIMAGILTYLRGSGLPDRLKAYQNKWKHIREYIEQREREFCLVGCDLDVQEEVFIVESMYQSLKSEMETARSAGDTKTQQPDDPRIRRSLLPTHNELSNQRSSTTPAKRSEVSHPQTREEHEPVSPIAAPEPSLEKS
ncbi:hypothetical protein N7528_005757 [Penicillium herquei]|nr:hypothetical protein N7528_005757 [Penicillium herquei]